MERRAAKLRQVSPERAKVWTEKPPKYAQSRRKVPVVYYLCRNRQLEHPHFIEVSLSSPDGLYLRDVFDKLSLLRGRGMASMYSWACKRSYKNGFVWHDLCEDDLIVPARGNEYVLKGSEIIAESNSGHLSPAATFMIQNVKQLPEPPYSISGGDASSSSSIMNAKEVKYGQEDEMSPLSRCSGCSGVSLDSRVGNSSSWGGSLALSEYKATEGEGVANASTQTGESARRTKLKETCTRGVSTDEEVIDSECAGDSNSHDQRVRRVSQTSSLSPLSSSSASPPPAGKRDTLESLIRKDASKISRLRILEEEDVRVTPSHRKLKASDMLLQLISCGSVSVKDHSFGLVPTYRPQFSHLKFPSPAYSTTSMLVELDCLPENPRFMDLRLEDKQYFSGSLVETKLHKEGDGHASLKRSSSYNADRLSRQDEEVTTTSSRSKCLPLSLKVPGSTKQPTRSPASDKSTSSCGSLDEHYYITARDVSNGSSKRFAPKENVSKEHDSVGEDRENIIKIEES